MAGEKSEKSEGDQMWRNSFAPNDGYYPAEEWKERIQKKVGARFKFDPFHN